MSKSYTGGLNFDWPVKHDTNWDSTVDTALETISAHDHSGAGAGGQIEAAGIAANAITGVKIRLDNNQALRARNAANSADVDILKLTTSDFIEILTAVVAATAGANGLTVTGNGVGKGVYASGGSNGIGVYGVGGPIGANAGVRGVGGSGGGYGGDFEGTGTGHGIMVEGGSSGDGVIAYGGVTSGVGGRFSARGGNSYGISAAGYGSGAGVEGRGGETGIGVRGIGGSSSGQGGHFTVSGASTADAVYASATEGGYCLVLAPDITSPVRATIRWSSQDAMPTGSHSVGDLYHTAGRHYVCTAAGTPGTWNPLGQSGTATNDSANAGYIGEYSSASVAQGAAGALTTATTRNVTSISLTAGDWDVSGIGLMTGSSTGTNFAVGITSTSATLPTADGLARNETPTTSTATSDVGLSIPPVRFSLAGTTTVYLVTQATFTVGAPASYGSLMARRVR